MRFSARRHEMLHLLTKSDRVLDDLSVQEIDERITTLRAEITRLEEARRAKQASLSAAAVFFKFDEFELRVCPDTLGRITKFSKHEPN